MERPRYQLRDGATVSRRAVNNHHLFYNDKWYAPGEEQRFRNLPGLVVPMHIPVHNDLHATLEPPLKPSKRLREQIAEYAHGLYEPDPYEASEQIIRFIGDIANSAWSPERADEAYRIHDQLDRQQVFLTLGRATLQGVAV